MRWLATALALSRASGGAGRVNDSALAATGPVPSGEAAAVLGVVFDPAKAQQAQTAKEQAKAEADAKPTKEIPAEDTVFNQGWCRLASLENHFALMPQVRNLLSGGRLESMTPDPHDTLITNPSAVTPEATNGFPRWGNKRSQSLENAMEAQRKKRTHQACVWSHIMLNHFLDKAYGCLRAGPGQLGFSVEQFQHDFTAMDEEAQELNFEDICGTDSHCRKDELAACNLKELWEDGNELVHLDQKFFRMIDFDEDFWISINELLAFFYFHFYLSTRAENREVELTLEMHREAEDIALAAGEVEGTISVKNRDYRAFCEQVGCSYKHMLELISFVHVAEPEAKRTDEEQRLHEQTYPSPLDYLHAQISPYGQLDFTDMSTAVLWDYLNRGRPYDSERMVTYESWFSLCDQGMDCMWHQSFFIATDVQRRLALDYKAFAIMRKFVDHGHRTMDFSTFNKTVCDDEIRRRQQDFAARSADSSTRGAESAPETLDCEAKFRELDFLSVGVVHLSTMAADLAFHAHAKSPDGMQAEWAPARGGLCRQADHCLIKGDVDGDCDPAGRCDFRSGRVSHRQYLASRWLLWMAQADALERWQAYAISRMGYPALHFGQDNVLSFAAMHLPDPFVKHMGDARIKAGDPPPVVVPPTGMSLLRVLRQIQRVRRVDLAGFVMGANVAAGPDGDENRRKNREAYERLTKCGGKLPRLIDAPHFVALVDFMVYCTDPERGGVDYPTYFEKESKIMSSPLAAKQTFAAMDVDHNYVVRADEFLPVSLFFHHATQGLHGAEHKEDFQDKAGAEGTAGTEEQKARQAASSIEEELHNSPHAVCFDEHLTVPNQGELLFPTRDLWKASQGAAPRWRGALVRGTDGEPVERTPEECLGLDLYGFLRLVEIMRFTDRVNLELEDGDGQDSEFLKLPTATDFVNHYPGLVWMMDVGISLQIRKAWTQPEFTKSKDSASYKQRADLERIFGKDKIMLDWVAAPDWWRITAQDALLRGPTAAAQLLPLLYATPLWPSDDMRGSEPSALCAPSPYVVLRALGIWLELGQLDYDYDGILRHEVFERSALARAQGGPFDWETLAGGSPVKVDLMGSDDGEKKDADADVALGTFSQYAPLSAMVAATSWMARMSDATRYDLEALEKTNGRLCAEKQLDFQRLKSAFWTGDVNHDGTLEPAETLVYAAWTALTAAFVLSADPDQFAVSRYQPERKEGEEGYKAEQADLNAKRLAKLADVVSQLSIDPEKAWYSCADGTSDGLCKRQGLAWDQAVRAVGSIDSEGQGLGASRHDTFAATDLDKDGKVRFVEFAVRAFARHRSVRAHVSRRLQLREGGPKNALRHVELLRLGDSASGASPTPDVRGPQRARRSRGEFGVEQLPDRLVPLEEFVGPSRGAESALHSRALDVQALFAIFGQDAAFLYGDAESASQKTTEVFREKDVMTVVSADRFLDLHEFYLCSEAPEKRRKGVLERIVKYDNLPQLRFADWMARSFAGAKIEWERQESQAKKPPDEIAFWEPSQQDVTLKGVTMKAVLTRWPPTSASGEADAGLGWEDFARFFPAKVCTTDWIRGGEEATAARLRGGEEATAAKLRGVEEATAAKPGTQAAQDLFYSANLAKVPVTGDGRKCGDVYREYMDKVKAAFTTGPRSVVQATKCVAFWMRGAGWPPLEPRAVQQGQCQLPGSKFCHAKAADNGACECLLEALAASDPLPSALEIGGLAQGLDLPKIEVLGTVGQRVNADGSVSAEARRVFE